MTAEPRADRPPGRLYIVGTPVGNLEDIPLRALRVLGEVEAIACEDTRQTLKILNRFGLKKTLISYFQPREGRRIPEIIGLLKAGRDVALVSDAGTPGISDPGFPLIREALKEAIPVIPIPGPSAVTAALSAAGLPTHRFLFVGFPPPKKTGLRKFLGALRDEKATLVFFLPTRRIPEFLEAVRELLGDRRVVIARELTKIHEEFIRGRAVELSASLGQKALKGEATVLVEGC
ncbi:MAG: 16S rRNA (cytidine(1402)-2'-O)-methyltransferase [Candidatus Aminicenantes bacterium]|nr:16S rRNA (cytidine(1402)-2'-O)-methyltransferase [Candidatus Aminicenantes bacterium]